MSEKTLNNIRIVHKHDIEANWLKAENFIPKQGELIIYDIDEFCSFERFKIGDGITNVNDLPFGDDAKVDIYQGEEHSGRILYVNTEGDVDITDAPEIMDVAYHEEERILEFVSKPQLPGNTSVDSSLTKAGDAADAKTVGDKLKELENRPAGGGGTISNVELLFTDDGEGNVVISIVTDNPEEDDNGAFDGGEITG